ncbi:MAG: PAS domain S-box protein [Desulfobacterales bacterium]|nr:PAS domain S-box protein [Desulfobacterales bacterium]
MIQEKHPGINKKVVLIVCLSAAIFLAIGVALGLWSGREMREVVGRQFNEEQLVIARNISNLVEREMNFLRKELVLLGKDISDGHQAPDRQYETIQKSLSHVLEGGVWRIDVVDLGNKKTHIYTSHRHWTLNQASDQGLHNGQGPNIGNNRGVWVSPPRTEYSGIDLQLAVSLAGASKRLLLFHVNVSWFLTPFLKNVRSGKTGYAWIIDNNGVFLFHPETKFVGRDAFKVRKERDASIYYGKINFIQKERMLKGLEGTGWYVSGWHRGITGEIKKLIAYSPIIISDNPPQKWSVAVAAPIKEVEEAIYSAYLRHFLLQGLIIVAVVLGAATILFFEIRWSRTLEQEVANQTWELKRSEEKYRSLVESAEDFIFTVDSEGHFQSMNSFTANFFGGCPEDFLGKKLSALFSDEIVERQLKLIRLVYRFEKSVRDEFMLTLGEHQTWISANFMPLKNEEGKVSSVLCIARDITENKQLERQLINTEKLASMGTLAAGVAHEINNPLGVILGFSDLLLEKTDENSQEYEDLKTIERQGLHCKQVVENLLSFARQGEGDDAERSDLNHSIEDIIKVVKHTLEMNNIELVLDLDKDIPQVKGDSRQLQQVFLNLINNAAAAMNGGGMLNIRTFMERGSRKAIVHFQDNGVGIKEGDIDRIFDPFFTTKPEGEGTGLGLFVSYGIITKYGGTINCVSHTADSPGRPRGTTFTIKLPITTQEG